MPEFIPISVFDVGTWTRVVTTGANTLTNFTYWPPISLTNTTTGIDITTQSWTRTVEMSTSTSSTMWGLWNAGVQDPVAFVADQYFGDDAQPQPGRERRLAVRARAEELLQCLLTPEQWQAYQANQAFEVVGSLGRRYRIKHGVSGNIGIIEHGVEVARLCAHPQTYDRNADAHLPTEDVLIGQLLHLTSDEASFLRVANVHHGRIPDLAA